MPLLIHIHESKARPVVACDHCGKVIEEAREGNYEWKSKSDGSTDGQVFFTHKACCHPFEAANAGDYQWAATELKFLPLFLSNNLKVDLEAAAESARRLSALG